MRTNKRVTAVEREVTARVVETVRGLEVRCPAHGLLLGVFNADGQLVIKCGDEFVVVEEPKA